MGIMSFIEERKSQMRQKQYVREEELKSQQEKDLILARARRGMLEEQRSVEKSMAEERNKIATLQGPSASSKIGQAFTQGFKTLNNEMRESRMRKAKENAIGSGKRRIKLRKQKETRSTTNFGSTQFLQQEVFPQDDVFQSKTNKVFK